MKKIKWWFRFYVAHFKEGESHEPYCVKAGSEKGLERCLPINGSWHGEAFSIEVKGNEETHGQNEPAHAEGGESGLNIRYLANK